MFKWLKDLLFPRPFPTKCIVVDSFTVNFMDYGELQKVYQAYNKGTDKKVNGFAVIEKREIWVSYDYSSKGLDGDYMPNTECLGHEVAHIIFGRWHK